MRIASLCLIHEGGKGMRSKILILLTVFGLVFGGLSIAQAATSSLDNVPGGAGVFYWEATSSSYTLVSIQNVATSGAGEVQFFDAAGNVVNGSASLSVHVAFYDMNSNHLWDFTCALSERDNFGFRIIGDGSFVTYETWGTPSYNDAGCDGRSFRAAGIGDDLFQYGYATVAINNIGVGAGTITARANEIVQLDGLNRDGNPDDPQGTNNTASNVTYGDVSTGNKTAQDAANNSHSDSTSEVSGNTSDHGSANPSEHGSSHLTKQVGADPRNGINFVGQTVVLPDWLFIRTAVIDDMQFAYALNGQMLQGFMNISALQPENQGAGAVGEAAASTTALRASTAAGVPAINVTGPNGVCSTIDWDNSGTAAGTAPQSMVDQGGVEINGPELFITDNAVYGGIAVYGGTTDASTLAIRSSETQLINGARVPVYAAACGINAEVMPALGAAQEPDGSSPAYWARFAASSAAETETTIITIFPASTGPAAVQNFGRTRTLNMLVYDDDEIFFSTAIPTPPEAARNAVRSFELEPTIFPILPGNSYIETGSILGGELFIQVAAPMFGYSYIVDQGVSADLFPIVRNRVNVNVSNILGAQTAQRMNMLSTIATGDSRGLFNPTLGRNLTQAEFAAGFCNDINSDGDCSDALEYGTARIGDCDLNNDGDCSDANEDESILHLNGVADDNNVALDLSVFRNTTVTDDVRIIGY
ncbi:secreted protein [Candidatus Magnetoovum chiemensis]|nr:secreted protein [Candidatus Magnetoovum chiemensis]